MDLIDFVKKSERNPIKKEDRIYGKKGPARPRSQFVN
jgi:hypothetical protein